MKASRRCFLLLPTLSLVTSRSAVRANAPPYRTTRIICGGDVMLSRYVGELARMQSDPASPLRDLAPLFSSADIAFVNLEAPFSGLGRPVNKGMIFKTEPGMIDALRLAGINVVSTANNHARDCGSYGVEFTLDWLARNGIAAAGTGYTRGQAHRGVVVERHGYRYGFLAYTYDQSNGNHTDRDDRIAMLDPVQMAADVAGLRTRADVVIVSMHAGIEYQRQPNAEQRRFAHAAIDAGAAAVIGAHPHVVQPVESYRGGVIFYSLGNLVFDQFQREETQHGLIADLRFAGARLSSYSSVPVDIVRTIPRVASVLADG